MKNIMILLVLILSLYLQTVAGKTCEHNGETIVCDGVGTDGSCDSENGACKCDTGYANEYATGLCVTTCGSCDASSSAYTGYCDKTATTMCDCDTGFALGKKGTCVYGYVCPTTCTGDLDIGTCIESDNTCIACIPPLVVDYLGLCVPGEVCGSGTVSCPTVVGSCNGDACDCATGYYIKDSTGECVPGKVCGSGTVSCPTAAGSCSGDACVCGTGYTNDSTTGECVKGSTCLYNGGDITCLASTAGTDGRCDSENKACNCMGDYVNDTATGLCVNSCGRCDGAGDTGLCDADGTGECECKSGNALSTGTDPTCVDTCGSCDGDGDTGLCDADGTGQCVCKPDYALGVKDTCVPGEECGSAATCTGGLNTGTCDTAGGTNCKECNTGEVVSDEGLCGVFCGTPTIVCVTGTGTCNSTTRVCDCSAGYKNAKDGTCVDVCDTSGALATNLVCPATITGYLNDTCTSKKGCSCDTDIDYANAFDGTCVNNCGNCDGDGKSGFCDVDGAAKCECADGYALGVKDTCVSGQECGSTATCTATDGATNTGTCDTAGGTNCKECDTGKAVSDEGLCVASVECGTSGSSPVTCTAGDSNDGTCAGDVCNCKAGYANNASGSCVDTCGECKGDGDTGLCDDAVGGTMKCECKAGYVLSTATDPVCVDFCREDAVNGPNCDAKLSGNKDGNCTPLAGCDCADGYENKADGTCADTICEVDPIPNCTDTGADATEDTCVPTVGCICSKGYANKADGACIDFCDTSAVNGPNCSINADGNCTTATGCDCSTGYLNKDDGGCAKGIVCGSKDCFESAENDGLSCVDGDKCGCKDGYANSKDDGACVLDCTTCSTGDEYVDGDCSKAGDVLTCTCADGYKHDTGDTMICKLDCSSCPTGVEYEDEQCTKVDDVLTCTCADGYTNPTALTCTNACGSSCTKEDSDPTKEYYEGTCTTFGGVASCVCTTDNKHNAENPLICETGSPCEGVTCSTDPGYSSDGECKQYNGFAKCPCEEPAYINGTDDLKICTLDCSKCTDPNGAEGCSLDGDVLTCPCKTGYKNGTDPLTCVEVTTSTSTGTTSASVTTSAAVSIRHLCTAFFLSYLSYYMLYLAIVE